MLTDPIADFLTRIRNATAARKATVDMPWSRQKEALARVLVTEGYLAGKTVIEAEPRPVLRIELRYDAQRRPVIGGLKRISRPSLRVYVGAKEIPPVLGGLTELHGEQLQRFRAQRQRDVWGKAQVGRAPSLDDAPPGDGRPRAGRAPHPRAPREGRVAFRFHSR